PQLAQSRLPRCNEILGIKRQKLIGETVVLFRKRRLLAGITKDPAIALHPISNVSEPLDEPVLKTVIGEKFWNPHAFKCRIASSLEHAGYVRAALLCGSPVASPGRSGL